MNEDAHPKEGQSPFGVMLVEIRLIDTDGRTTLTDQQPQPRKERKLFSSIFSGLESSNEKSRKYVLWIEGLNIIEREILLNQGQRGQPARGTRDAQQDTNGKQGIEGGRCIN